MILLGIFLILELHAMSAFLGGQQFVENYLMIHFDSEAFFFVFLCLLAVVQVRGYKKFFRGLGAVIRLPKTGDAEIAAYFRRLTFDALLIGLVGMLIGGVANFFLIRCLDIVGSYIAFSLFAFSYSAWIAVMLFWPIANRFAADVQPIPSPRNGFPVGLTLVGLTAYFLARAIMVMLLISLLSSKDGTPTVQFEDLGFIATQALFSLNPVDLDGHAMAYLNPVTYWDCPCFVMVLLSLGAVRLAAGPLKNRLDWVPVSILVGVLWAIEGMICMLCDLDPELYVPGCMVSLLTAFYGFIAATLFAMSSLRQGRRFQNSDEALTETEEEARQILDSAVEKERHGR